MSTSVNKSIKGTVKSSKKEGTVKKEKKEKTEKKTVEKVTKVGKDAKVKGKKVVAAEKAVTQNNGIIRKQDLYMTKLTAFFVKPGNMDKMLNILQQKSCISLRILDWFVTNYAKSKNISYNVSKKSFNVHYDYRSQLKGYSKKYFDPFCRTGKDNSRLIEFAYDLEDTDKTLSTTVGQLNFFKWAIENDVISYVEKFFDGIEADMSASINARKKKNDKDGKELVETGKKRTPFNVSATKTWTRTNTKFVISFD